MKAKELRNLTNEELEQKMEELYKKLFQLRSDIKIGRLEKPHEIKECKRDIARIKTIINERKRQESSK
ncbi:MAG: 50S ribosomal protein L29 [Candidatus Omnitrophota bacterium]|nr:MAG: 50S ribosomal protein L29 [Candidatus Omnitrophota bacterium]